MNLMDKEIIIQKVVKIIRKYFSEDYKIFLFGSWAKGNALETSDLDIGILGPKKAPWSLMVKILSDIDGIPTLRKIDVVDFNTKAESFRQNVLSYSQPL